MTNRKFPPREGDLPVAKLMERADEVIRRDLAKGIHTDIMFKYTCEECGERCMLSEPNQLFEYGECHKCGHQTRIEVGGFTLVSRLMKGQTQ
jgi:rRNA maturation endonuclease Nob1